MVSGIQLVGIIFALIQGYFTFLHYKREEFTIREFIAWEILWISLGYVTIFPRSFELFSGTLGAIRPLDLFSLLGFIVVLSISFYTYVNVDRLRKKLEKTIRDLALSEMDEEKKKK